MICEERPYNRSWVKVLVNRVKDDARMNDVLWGIARRVHDDVQKRAEFMAAVGKFENLYRLRNNTVRITDQELKEAVAELMELYVPDS